MTDTDIIDIDPRPIGDRRLMHALYAMHTVAWLSFGALALISLIINYIRRADDPDSLYRAHHAYMISTFWWTLIWLVVTSPLYLFFVLPGVLAHAIVGIWYLYRCLRGWLRFAHRQPPRQLVL